MKKKRVLLKLSGELIGNFNNDIIPNKFLSNVSKNISILLEHDIETCIVVGGGNIIRQNKDVGNYNLEVDNIGMVSTVLNALYLKCVFSKEKISSRVFSPVEIANLSQKYVLENVLDTLSKHIVPIFAFGTGIPFVSTDTTSVIRALELKCDVLLKATKVSGIFSTDPKKDSNTKKFNRISYQEVIEKNLLIMDMPAIIISKNHNLQIKIFQLSENNKIIDIINNKGSFSVIEN